MDTIIDQQVAMDEALVPTTQRLRIGRSNFRLLSDIKSKESTLQLVYDVLRICPFFKAFLATADMDTKKHIVNLESFRDMLYICPRVHGQSFDEPSFEEEILAFIYFLGQSAAIRMLTDDPSIPRKNKVNWHYVRDDHMFSTIKLVSRHKNTQQFGALLPIELTNDEIKNSKAYKEYYTITIGEAALKPKASVRRTKSSSDTSITPPTAAVSPRMTASAKGKQTTKESKAKSLSALSEVAMIEAQQLKLVTKRSMQQTHYSQPSGSGVDEETSSKPGVLNLPTDESEEELSGNSTDDKGDDNKEKDDDAEFISVITIWDKYAKSDT
nr:hypothetical protein [Tanacetum cinerariifolium]